jgi:uncharacterized protein
VRDRAIIPKSSDPVPALYCPTSGTMDTRGAKAYILSRLKDELDPARTYHSFQHTLDVYASAITIGEEEGVTGEELELLKTAALFHDVGFLHTGEEHEAASCAIIEEVLPRFAYTPEHVERISAMVMATRVPQRPEDALARILCDADLDYLGRPDFRWVGDTLFAEMKSFGQLGSEREWNELQVRFLDAHRYFTSTSQRLREPVKQQNLAAVRQWLVDHP